MKRNKIIVVFSVVLMACCNLYNSNVTAGMSNVAIENVEALADSEWVNGKGWSCYRWIEDDVNDEIFSVVTYCGDCSSYAATSYTDSDFCTFSGMYN